MPGLTIKSMTFAGAAMTLALSACASGPRPTSVQPFALGANANGDPCSASANWTDESFGEVYSKYPDSFSVNCSGTSTSTLARVRVFDSAARRAEFGNSGLTCGDSVAVQLAGFSNAMARNCIDPSLGFATIVIDADVGGVPYQISAAPNAVGAGYQAALILAGIEKSEGATSARTPIQISAVPSLPDSIVAAPNLDSASEEYSAVLSRGTALNFRGLHADASRYLRGELNDLPAETSDRIRAEILLEAALADSNIQFFQSAGNNLDEAETLINRLGSADQRILRPKLGIYRGLDALNRRDFNAARRLLTPLVARERSSGGDLNDPTVLVRLNSAVGNKQDVRSSIALPDLEVLRETFMAIQASWALSVAEFSLGNETAALAAIATAEESYSDLSAALSDARIEENGLFWLNAKLLRQRGRVQASAGNFDEAISSFDLAVEQLTRGALARSGTGSDPAIAEVQLERASLFERAGRPAAEVDQAYNSAIDAILDAREEGSGFPTALLHPFLDQLAARMGAGDQQAAARFFEVLQVSGESSAARQVSQLQDIVAQDSNIGTQRRQRQDLQRQLTQLRLDIVDARRLGLPVDEMESSLAQVQARFFEVDAELQADARLSQVSSKPAQLSEVQEKLKDDEGYIRLSVMGDRVFGILIEKGSAHAIMPNESSAEILALSSGVRQSADFDEETGRVPGFAVDLSAVLYRSLFGEIDDIVKSKKELVFDGGKVLASTPPAMLVTDVQSAVDYSRQADKRDYSQIKFLATRMPTTVAMSPRAFIASRNLPATRATKPLLGFASPEGLGKQPVGSGGKFQIGPCLLDADKFRQYTNRFAPIPSTEIQLASQALGLPGSPTLISGPEFSDVSVKRLGGPDGELSDYKVLHFATHGVTEGQFDCDRAPAALITSYGGTRDSDLLLSFEEIAGLRLDANLVVLAACDTASETSDEAQVRSGEARPGSTLDGLVRAFFAAGARSVVATYWEASNTGPTELFMDQFYTAGRTQDIANSLNDAQRTLQSIPETSHPYFWAGFFVVGDTDNRMLDGSQSQVAMK